MESLPMNHAAAQPWVVLLAGGRGTRLGRLHPDVPKPLIRCLDRPFIEWVIRHFRDQGLHRFIVSLGHLADVAEEHFRRREGGGEEIRTEREPAALGTGGGLRWAWRAAPEADVIAANADSLVLADLRPALELFGRPEVDGVLLGLHQDDASRYGTMRTGPEGRLLAFEEKKPGPGLINAGVYFLKNRLRSRVGEGPMSLEREVFPRWLGEGRDLRVAVCRAPFLDIGTPESLAEAEGFLRTWGPPEARP
jgi:D-glycero-alpha-D-manno-heptose 1-phosphate guanylyltransferase